MIFRVDRKSGWQDWANLFLAILLFSTPWVFEFAATPAAAWNAWIGGALVAALAVLALSRFAEWEEWLNAIIGVWLMASPWALGFAAVSAALWSDVALGFLIALISGWKADDSHGGGRLTA